MSNPTPKDLAAYLETHFEISAYLMETIDIPGKMSHYAQESQGRGGLYELAQTLTENFEKMHEGKFWDGDFFEALDKYVIQIEAEHQNEIKPIIYEDAALRIRLTGTIYAIQYTADNYFAHYFQTLAEAKKYAGIK